MNRFEKVKKYFDDGLWNINRVANAVLKGGCACAHGRDAGHGI